MDWHAWARDPRQPSTAHGLRQAAALWRNATDVPGTPEGCVNTYLAAADALEARADAITNGKES